ncbi:amidohydrolase [Streptomyces clavuligerus]|uniref:Putative metal-dependent amidase/aminoacylase/carboxypeptidase n=1 Tax=Streptomyces clavuligerus TaxID=1901 RepID=E2Q3E8_STRCL|nr:amidohydrolase [Streptomyces clavuligerus]ANW18496.1 N-acyl-L-amino acid amidohydrolase [Streptomyces clavuligerus]AXU13052.1 amidohydrolase [Streptomyces clavuligerus]EFG08863.1 Putative metal-dependent amidase/aminoacylase/carboxypeptidase [Streptomyces clavuligerus]MBY6302988.1 amidohydrolase [Streptomyces clavuligerus]QCS05835.1 amidohydrolase [Streptomyces clavuligerus]
MSREPETDLPGSAALPGTLSTALRDELIAFRRDLHMHPELGNQEFRTTAALKERLERAGLRPRVLPTGTGLVCDIGVREDIGARNETPPHGAAPDAAPGGGPVPAAAREPIAGLSGDLSGDLNAGLSGETPLLALRADIDALPIPDTKAGVAYRSTVPERAHACGHDVHTTAVLGAGLVLAELHRQGLLPRPVRLIFQPAEEVLPGGATDVIDAGALDGVGKIIAVHCDPKVDAGVIGLRPGPITSACDRLEIALDGPGGHTARPHLTTDLVTAAAKVAAEVPALLSRRVDARAGLAVTWGRIAAGHACNVIPQHAELSGTVRCLDLPSWRAAPDLVHTAVDEIARLYGAKPEVTYVRGVPPVVNDPVVAELLREAQTARRGVYAVEDTEQSLGGEDFSWYLEHVPGAMARLGVRTPGDTAQRDLHRGDFDVDEYAIEVGVELFTAAALLDVPRN